MNTANPIRTGVAPIQLLWDRLLLTYLKMFGTKAVRLPNAEKTRVSGREAEEQAHFFRGRHGRLVSAGFLMTTSDICLTSLLPRLPTIHIFYACRGPVCRTRRD